MSDNGRAHNALDANSVVLRESMVAQSALLTAEPERAVVRPWVRVERERGVLGVSRFTQYGNEYEFRSDEAVDRGGEGRAPSPMRYMLSGVAFCLQGWTSKVFASQNVPVDAVTVELRTQMDMRGELLIDEVAAYPQWLVAELTLATTADAAVVIVLAHEAAQRCPLSALIKRAIPLYLVINLRGVIVLDERPVALQNEKNEEQTR